MISGSKSPKVTVLMSVYNGRKYLAKAVESILDQTFRDFEFLIINDGSTEPVEQVITSYRDARIVLVNQENAGLTRSLNKGLALARGAYVARMDSDDISLPTRLQAQVAAMEADANLDLVGCFFDVVDEHGDLIERKELITDPIYRLWRLRFHNNYGHGSVMLKKKAVIDAGMYDENLRYAQDFDLWSRLSTKSNTKVIPEALYSYRMVSQGSQASVANYDLQLRNAILISNRSLTACNPGLTEADCEEVRALYWKFQLDSVSPRGIELLPATLEGFCRRFGIEGQEKSALIRQVIRDTLGELDQIGLTMSEEWQKAVADLKKYGQVLSNW
ncbi:MAG: glycosyltransferase [Desulfomonile tiedjei]|nr:glycosyltransferase [Desulfomonile tiedjei]